ncbi:hypothetical protein BDZ97DRAFT_1902510 [Flammula alnicola]|nr:hypothetical protein BDZ97DRAFT_1902510 [Flammula alnicola]
MSETSPPPGLEPTPDTNGTSTKAANGAFSLENILGENPDAVEHPASGAHVPDKAAGWDEEDAEAPLVDGYCVECEDQPAEVLCETCSDAYCEVCFAAQHRKGSRKTHPFKPLSSKEKKAKTNGVEPVKASGDVDEAMKVDGIDDTEDSDDEDWERVVPGTAMEITGAQPPVGAKVGEWFVERAKFIPLRGSYRSEYTDKIDTIGFGLSKTKRIVHQIRELCAIMSGLLLSADYKRGQELFTDRDFQSNAEFYQTVFELGRRHKIMNPDKMRTTYGKLIYLLQVCKLPDKYDPCQGSAEFLMCYAHQTVYSILEEHGAVELLRDDLITIATKEIYSEGRPRRDVQKDIKSKERAIEILSSHNHAFLRANRDPCERMIVYLKEYFHPTQAKDPHASLAIRSGKGGARLSHDHSKQYAYVLQSLTLWREILHDMFHLWSLAEQDLLSENVPYRLRDTGQGLNRVQAAPKTSRMMHNILHKAQKSVGTWIGSSVIHMGDHNVPNALLFIDKYTQIYRILLPICNTLSQIPTLAQKPALRSYIDDEFGSVDNCIREILGDFFRHGFDGSGADNFFDAGSCIDGRLTSAWNWCSSLEKKRFFPIFLLSGFIGFDGDW